LASNQSHFTERYGFYAFDEHEGNLNNGGEKIVGVNSAGDTVINVLYDDSTPWPLQADGQGYTLVPKEFNPQSDQNDPDTWRASLEIHGSPGRNDELNTTINNEPGYEILTFNLAQNYPNPFNNSTMIKYQLPSQANVSIKVYDVIGRMVKNLYQGNQSAGNHSIAWNGNDNNNILVTSGVYFYRIQFEDGNTRHTFTKKMILLK
jgi:hypothetical protein